MTKHVIGGQLGGNHPWPSEEIVTSSTEKDGYALFTSTRHSGQRGYEREGRGQCESDWKGHSGQRGAVKERGGGQCESDWKGHSGQRAAARVEPRALISHQSSVISHQSSVINHYRRSSQGWIPEHSVALSCTLAHSVTLSGAQ